ncbi:probable aminoacyl tRNA synthase complex-interacting multifunctional protein 2 isoform X2 [Contarinia nasturtii]|uniref:probable aminoacyl tRNA synthase complex-interacting multifunctional protein 2 isoform X2 n=1 Tax=Contarinia nasturtii TaxID=265458 RepID=UPI0012D48927|nr:probable aminoacyl tRNA synthase complex-interacting multifunctional protein 2 isoform X2 [Contarinia nasturtii]
MYEIKPTFDRSTIQVDLPTCMYKMKNTNDFNLKDSQSSNVQLTNGLNGATSNGNDLTALQLRQGEIIKQLEKLRLKLNDMQGKLGVTAEPVAVPKMQKVQKKVAPVIKPIDEKYLQDIVVHVNPANVPYSLLGLQTLWTNRLNLVIECYTHSSIAELPVENQAFVKRVGSFKANATAPTLNLSLIWKDTPTTNLVCAPGTFIPISGEANILRYLLRIGPSEFGYLGAGSIQAQMEIDALFDLIHELVLASAKKDHRSSILKRLSQRLNTQTAFGGDSTNVSDYAVFSTLKQLNLTAKELPANVKTWYERNKTLIQV